MVVYENNRCYSYLGQMQNDSDFCDINLYKVLFGVVWVMQGWDVVGHARVGWVMQGWGGVGHGGL